MTEILRNIDAESLLDKSTLTLSHSCHTNNANV
jgi:hypothetical protein